MEVIIYHINNTDSWDTNKRQQTTGHSADYKPVTYQNILKRGISDYDMIVTYYDTKPHYQS